MHQRPRRAARAAPWVGLGLALAVLGLTTVGAEEPGAAPGAVFVPSAERGYRWLTTKPYVPPSLDAATWDALWTQWPEPLRQRAEKASPAERRRLAFERYGLTPRPAGDDPMPLQYVADERGRWVISCFACHAGQVGEQVLPGLPNAHLALQDLSDDAAAVHRAARRPLPAGELMWRTMPLGTTHGTTNAVMFSVALLALRDADLNVVPPSRPLRFVHHDLDAPPWWHVARRKTLYADGFTPRSHRPLMQFLLVPTNGPTRLKEWEPDFRDILAYVESVRAPRWPFGAVDAELATRGRGVFERTCARCHGTYGEAPTYPERAVPIDDVGTDRVRFEALTAEEREAYAHSWFTDRDPTGVTVQTVGYVAPPLDGVWASAPYFHNGSVPTLWHLLHPDARPQAWRRAGPPAYDRERVGLALEAEAATVPEGLLGWERRAWFDAAGKGKSAAGHRYPAALAEPEKRALLEYLKTL